MRTCWVTGAGGLIGSAVMRSVPAGWNVLGLSRSELELTDRAAVERRFALEQPDAVIHCAAMSRSPQCQSDPAGARLWNVEVTRHLAELFAGRRLACLSTDLVFDGASGGYDEDAPVRPLSFYAETKVEAESWVRRDPGHLVVRTSLNHGTSPTGDRGFNEEMANAWAAGRTLRLFTDEFRTPIPAESTARALWELLPRQEGGVLHIAGAERLSRWQIGQHLARSLAGRSCPIEPGSLREFHGAPRSPDTSLDCRRAQALLTFPLPRYSEWLGQRGGHVEFVHAVGRLSSGGDEATPAEGSGPSTVTTTSSSRQGAQGEG
jgi:dTDP-4-dehydrorhamnose reductase